MIELKTGMIVEINNIFYNVLLNTKHGNIMRGTDHRGWIRLTKETIKEIEKVFQPSLEYRYLQSSSKIDPDTEIIWQKKKDIMVLDVQNLEKIASRYVPYSKTIYLNNNGNIAGMIIHDSDYGYKAIIGEETQKTTNSFIAREALLKYLSEKGYKFFIN